MRHKIGTFIASHNSQSAIDENIRLSAGQIYNYGVKDMDTNEGATELTQINGFYESSTSDEKDRVRAFTPEIINRKIDFETESRIRDAVTEGRIGIERRLDEIDREWDINRVFMIGFSILTLTELLFARKNKKWLWGPLIQTPFLFMHATLGWSPPSLWLRPMGFRTGKEIQSEREALLRALTQNANLH